jgi:diguanylate cyclase (GGDEF)-like protein
MSRAASDRGTALLALERKRVLDFVWIVTLAVEACSLALLGWMGIAERGVATVSRSLLVYGATFVLIADLSYRMKTPRAVHLSICANQCGGILFLVYLWARSGGVGNPDALAYFVPPLLVSGLVGMSWLWRASTALALVSIWSVAYHQAGVLPWHAFASPEHGVDAQSARILLLWSAGAIGLALSSKALSAALERLFERTRSYAAGGDAGATLGAVMRGASDPTVILYADTLQLAHASDSFYLRMLLDRERVAGRSLYNLIRFANRERMEAMLEQDSGVIPFQQVEIGPEPIAVNLRFFHSEHAGTRYLHIAFEEVTDLFYFQLAFDAIEDPVLIVGDVGQLYYSNRAASALLGELYVGKPMLALLRSHRLVASVGFAAARNRERVVLGDSLFHQSVLTPRMGLPGQASRVFWLRKFTEDEARVDRASRDALTGVLNRRTFEHDLHRQIHDATTSAPVSLALWSLDHFKEMCEEHGEPIGDQVLRTFASVLGEQIRPGDGFYRLDGETFAIVFPAADLHGAESAVQRLLVGLGDAAVEIDGDALAISASAGVTVAKPREATAALMARADAALYAAKDGGGGCCVPLAPDVK